MAVALESKFKRPLCLLGSDSPAQHMRSSGSCALFTRHGFIGSWPDWNVKYHHTSNINVDSHSWRNYCLPIKSCGWKQSTWTFQILEIFRGLRSLMVFPAKLLDVATKLLKLLKLPLIRPKYIFKVWAAMCKMLWCMSSAWWMNSPSSHIP